MTGKLSPRVGEARDTAVSHYVFEAPVRLWHWLTVACMLVLMVTGYFIGRPLPSVSGEATYLFYMGYIRLIHFAAAMIFTVLLLGRIYWACVGNHYSRELFIVPVWRRSWWQGAFTVVRWYLFLEKKPGSDIGHNPVAQAAMFGYFLLSVFMILTGFALFGEHSQYAIFAPFRYVVVIFLLDRRQLHRYSQLAPTGHVADRRLHRRARLPRYPGRHYVRRYGDLHHDQWLSQP